MLAVTEDDTVPVQLPLNLVESLNEQFKKFPDGVPMTMQSGEQIEVLALMVCCKHMAERRPVMLFASENEKTP
jgi:alpha-D-ribose 1-methylphosphonate 5-triphosphate synthase subunit PhnH